LELKCVNDETGLGGAPYWDPPYEHDVVDFPKCKVLRKYKEVTMKGIHVNTIDKKDIIELCELKRVKNLNLTNMYLFLNHKCPCMMYM